MDENNLNKKIIVNYTAPLLRGVVFIIDYYIVKLKCCGIITSIEEDDL